MTGDRIELLESTLTRLETRSGIASLHRTTTHTALFLLPLRFLYLTQINV